jgi:hypothetical protein
MKYQLALATFATSCSNVNGLLTAFSSSRTVRVVGLKSSASDGDNQRFLPIGDNELETAGREPEEMKTLTVNGLPIHLDKLGPVVVSHDGALGSIANWHELNKAEQTKVMGKVAKRNQQRLAALREAQNQSSSNE